MILCRLTQISSFRRINDKRRIDEKSQKQNTHSVTNATKHAHARIHFESCYCTWSGDRARTQTGHTFTSISWKNFIRSVLRQRHATIARSTTWPHIRTHVRTLIVFAMLFFRSVNKTLCNCFLLSASSVRAFGSLAHT